MAKTRNFDHPEGPDNIPSVINTKRGRWRCQDSLDNEPVYSTVSGTCIDRPRNEAKTGAAAATTAAAAGVDAPQQSPVRDADNNEAREETAKTCTCAETQRPDQDVEGLSHRKLERMYNDAFHDLKSEVSEVERAKNEDNPATSEQTLDLDIKKKLGHPDTLDTNSNASPRKTTSSTVITNRSTSRDTEVAEETKDSVNRTELVAVTLVACIVLLPHLIPFWSVSGDSWNILHVLWRMVFQAIAVAFSTGLVLLALQVHFPSYHLRQLVAQVFQLEIKEETTKTGPTETPHETERKHTDKPLEIGDGDKKPDILSSGEHRAGGQQKAVPNDISGLITDVQDVTREADRIPEGPKVSETKETRRERTDTTAQTIGPGKRPRQALKRFHRKFLRIRHRYKSEIWKLKHTDQEASEMLSRVQLGLPALEREKQALLAELEAIHKQHQEEKRRNQDLIARLHRLNQQFMRVGVPPQVSTTTSAAIGQPPESHHQQHYDSQRPQPQPYHTPQQQQQQHHQQQQQHQQHHQQIQQQQQQGRLPVSGQRDGVESKVDATPGSAGRNTNPPRSTVCGPPALPYSAALCSQPTSAQVALRPFQQQQK